MRQAPRVLAGVLVAGVFAGGSAALADDGSGDRADRGDRQGRQHALAPALVFTLDPATATLDGNPEGVAFDRRSGAFFVSRVGAGAIFRGTTDGGDGLLLDRGRLIVVQGSNPAVANGAKGVITFIEMRRHRTRGTVVANRTDPSLAGPSTVARARGRYLVANANFGGPADGPFTVSGLDRGSGQGRGHGGGRDRAPG
jgi:hypothetical protein